MKILKLIPLLVILGVVGYYNKDITNYIIENFIYYNENIKLDEPNEYKLDYTFKYVKSINDFNVTSKEQLMKNVKMMLIGWQTMKLYQL